MEGQSKTTNMKKKFLLLAALLSLTVLFFSFDLGQYLTLNYVKQQQAQFELFYSSNATLTVLTYLAIYITSTALSLPGAAILTLLGGAIFGAGFGTLIVSFASTIGATLAFLVARFILRDSIQKKFSDKLSAINKGIGRDGAFYLFTLRLIPAFPFFLINLVMGLTPIKTWRFFLVSQIGMLPGTFVYVNAGTQLSRIDSLQGILSPGLLLSFALLGVFPFAAKGLINIFKAKKIYAPYRKPKKFDYNLVAIGGGSAGLVTTYIGAAVKAKVALIEKHRMGGDCLNTGCVPSKALIKTAKILSYAKRAEEYGIKKFQPEFEFSEIMERIQKVIQKIEPHDSIERYSQLGVDCITGTARIKSPFEIEVDGKTITTKNIVIATGARPLVPPIPGIDHIPYVTSDTVWDLREKPKRLLVLGGGPIGSELAQSFARLGCEVTQIEMGKRILAREDLEVSELLTNTFKAEGVQVLTEHKAKEFLKEGPNNLLIAERPNGEDVRIPFDQCLIAIGRKANVENFGLEELGVTLSKRGTIEHDEFLRTRFPNIYACGDVAGPYQFTHTAAHQAWFAAVNALFSPLKTFKADYRVIPWCTFTDPEVARVGLNEIEAQEQNLDYETTTYGLDDLDRSIADGEDHGFVKVLTATGSDKILGVTIVGDHSGDYITEFVAAMKHGFGLNKILGTIHIYPTLGEANKYVAGNWKKAHAPKNLLKWVQKFHAWRL